MDEPVPSTPEWGPTYQLGDERAVGEKGILNGVQNHIQHWLLAPGAKEGDPNLREEDHILGMVFRFNSEDKFNTFRSKLEELERDDLKVPRVRGKIVYFPALKPVGIGETEIALVGLTYLSNASILREILLGGPSPLGEIFLTGLPVLEPLADFVPEPPEVSADGRFNVIMDTEIAFANARFLKGGKTRIATYWDQGARPDALNPLSIGRVLSAADIDDMRDTHEQAGNVDEWALYAEYDTLAYGHEIERRLPAAVGHGTHVLDTFTGGDASDVPILAVELPQYAVDRTHGHMLTIWVLLTLQWLATIKSQNSGFRAVLNYSFGGIAGRHDGLGFVEQLFDAAIDRGIVSAVVVPAGNTFGTQTHAAYSGADLVIPKRLEWNIQPDDGTSSILEIWLPECRSVGSQSLELKLTPPMGPSRTFNDTDFGVTPLFNNGQLLALVFVLCVEPLLLGKKRTVIAVAARHTAQDRNYFSFFPGLPELAGAWQIDLKSLDLTGTDHVEMWIERDDLLFRARTGARQSYFTAQNPIWPERAPIDPVVRNAGTISDIATGKRTLVAAGHVASQLQPAVYSSEGFADCDGAVPTASAVCEDSPALPGVLGSGYFSDSTVPMGGTSTSSAKIGRLAANMLDNGQAPTRSAVESVANAQDGRVIPDTKQLDLRFDTYNGAPPRTRIGAGCLARVGSRVPDRFDPDAAP